MVKKIVFNPLNGFDFIDKLKSTNYLGSNCSGPEGKNRTLTSAKPVLLIVDNQLLHPIVDYTHSGSTITFLNDIWNNQDITVWR